MNSEHKIVRAAGAPLDPARLYRVLVDTYDLAKDPTLSSYAKANPTRIPQADPSRSRSPSNPNTDLDTDPNT